MEDFGLAIMRSERSKEKLEGKYFPTNFTRSRLGEKVEKFSPVKKSVAFENFLLREKVEKYRDFPRERKYYPLKGVKVNFP